MSLALASTSVRVFIHHARHSISSVPMASAMTVPAGPAAGRNVVPGMTNAPQPTMQPKAMAQTSSLDR